MPSIIHACGGGGSSGGYKDKIYTFHVEGSKGVTKTYYFDEEIDPTTTLVIRNDFSAWTVYKILEEGVKTSFSNSNGYMTIYKDKIEIEPYNNVPYKVDVISFDAKKIQYIKGSGSAIATEGAYRIMGFAIEEVDAEKTDIYGYCTFNVSDLSSTHNSTIAPPYLYDSTHVGIVKYNPSYTTYSQVNCVVIERG